MKKLAVTFSVVSLFVFTVAAIGARAQAPENDADTLVIYKDEMKTVHTDSPTRIVIGNPDIADVTSVGTKEMVVAGKTAGMTNLLWWDKNGERSMRVKVLTEEMAYVKSRIDDLLAQMNITTVTTKSADAEGRVLLTGHVKSAADLQQITSALGDLSAKTINLITLEEEEATVELDVEVLEVDQDGGKELGIVWPSALALKEPLSSDTTLRKTPDSLFKITKWTHGQLSTQIDFLVQEGKARVLSRPRLACQSGKQAELLVGGETPVLTSQVISGATNQATSVDYKEYGIKLKMSPVVMVDSKIRLTMAVEVSDIAAAPLTLGTEGSPTALAFPLTKRNTSTQLVLNDNQTLAISGLIKQQTSDDVQKVPFLGDLPIVGLMFRHRKVQHGNGPGARGDTELVVMVTPRIIKAAAVSVSSAAPANAEQKTVQQPVPAASAAVPAFVPEMRPPPPQALKTNNDPVQKGNSGSLDDYVRTVAQYISGKLVYPEMAKRTQAEGTVKLALRLSNTGELLDSNLSQSSGNAVLDADALSVSKEIAPYPSFPDSISDKDIWIQVPISYKLTTK